MSKTYNYEGMFLISQGVAADLGGAVQHITDILAKVGAELISMRKWDERRLAYPLRSAGQLPLLTATDRPWPAGPSDRRQAEAAAGTLRVREKPLEKSDRGTENPQPVIGTVFRVGSVRESSVVVTPGGREPAGGRARQAISNPAHDIPASELRSRI